jgi:hypothetical protein
MRRRKAHSHVPGSEFSVATSCLAGKMFLCISVNWCESFQFRLSPSWVRNSSCVLASSLSAFISRPVPLSASICSLWFLPFFPINSQTSTRSWCVPFSFGLFCFSWTFLMVYSKAMLKCSGDKASPCVRPFWAVKWVRHVYLYGLNICFIYTCFEQTEFMFGLMHHPSLLLEAYDFMSLIIPIYFKVLWPTRGFCWEKNCCPWTRRIFMSCMWSWHTLFPHLNSDACGLRCSKVPKE